MKPVLPKRIQKYQGRVAILCWFDKELDTATISNLWHVHCSVPYDWYCFSQTVKWICHISFLGGCFTLQIAVHFQMKHEIPQLKFAEILNYVLRTAEWRQFGIIDESQRQCWRSKVEVIAIFHQRGFNTTFRRMCLKFTFMWYQWTWKCPRLRESVFSEKEKHCKINRPIALKQQLKLKIARY